MKLATYAGAHGQRVGAVVDDEIYDVAACMRAAGEGDSALAADMLTLLGAGEGALDAARSAVAQAQESADPALSRILSEVTLSAPLPCPGKLMCLAGNYASHIEEGGGSFVGKEKMIPRFFIKPCTAVTATGDKVKMVTPARDRSRPAPGDKEKA